MHRRWLDGMRKDGIGSGDVYDYCDGTAVVVRRAHRWLMRFWILVCGT